jgi:hypothetical protein
MKAPNKQRGKNVIFDQIKVDGLQYDLRSELNCFALGVLRGNKLVIVRIGVYMYYSGNLHFWHNSIYCLCFYLQFSHGILIIYESYIRVRPCNVKKGGIFFLSEKKIIEQKYDVKNAKINDLILQFSTRNFGNIKKNVDFSCL